MHWRGRAKEGEKLEGERGREKSGDEPYQTERKGEQAGPQEEEKERGGEQSCSVLPPMKLLMGEEEEGAEKSSGRRGWMDRAVRKEMC